MVNGFPFCINTQELQSYEQAISESKAEREDQRMRSCRRCYCSRMLNGAATTTNNLEPMNYFFSPIVYACYSSDVALYYVQTNFGHH